MTDKKLIDCLEQDIAYARANRLVPTLPPDLATNLIADSRELAFVAAMLGLESSSGLRESVAELWTESLARKLKLAAVREKLVASTDEIGASRIVDECLKLIDQ